MFSILHDLAGVVRGGIRDDLCDKSEGCSHLPYPAYRQLHAPAGDSFTVSDALHAAAHHGMRERNGHVMQAFNGQRSPVFNTAGGGAQPRLFVVV
ncbi:MAG: hypothetical protein AB7P76_00265 [Candidatus Melainabacteria bacterium]